MWTVPSVRAFDWVRDWMEEILRTENMVLTLSTNVTRKLADLNIEVEFQLVDE